MRAALGSVWDVVRFVYRRRTWGQDFSGEDLDAECDDRVLGHHRGFLLVLCHRLDVDRDHSGVRTETLVGWVSALHLTIQSDAFYDWLGRSATLRAGFHADLATLRSQGAVWGRVPYISDFERPRGGGSPTDTGKSSGVAPFVVLRP